MTRAAGDQLEVAVTYWPADVGPYMWHEFRPENVARDLAAITALRIPVVRLLLSWDAFMPTDRRPHPRRMRDLEAVLDLARGLGLRVVLTLFAQSLGDCVMLPGYAVDGRAPRTGVRCLTDGRPVPGGPRDIYDDPLMLEVQVRWLDAMLAAFAHHPALEAWDLGYDPATTVRPRRTAQMATWCALLAERVHAQEEECRLTLGQDDVVTARGVRPGALASSVDVVGLLLAPHRLPLAGDALEPGRAVFVLELAQALAGRGTALAAEVSLPGGEVTREGTAAGSHIDDVTAPPAAARRATDQLVQRLVASGAASLGCAAWADWGARLHEAPPSDRMPWLANVGIVDSAGVSKPVAGVWENLAARDTTVATASPYPASIDVESYYANLPDSLHDLHASWQGDRGDTPAILG